MSIKHADRILIFNTPIIKEQIHRYINSQALVSKENLKTLFSDLLLNTLNKSLAALIKEESIELKDNMYCIKHAPIISPSKRLSRAAKLLQTFTSIMLATTAEVPNSSAKSFINRNKDIIKIGLFKGDNLYRFKGSEKVRADYDKKPVRAPLIKQATKAQQLSLQIRKLIKDTPLSKEEIVNSLSINFSRRQVLRRLAAMIRTKMLYLEDDKYNLSDKGSLYTSSIKDSLWKVINELREFTYKDVLERINIKEKYLMLSIQRWTHDGYIKRLKINPAKFILVKTQELSPNNQGAENERRKIRRAMNG